MLRLGVSLLAAAAVLTGGAAAGESTPTVFGTVGPGFTISLRDAQGNGISHLDPGAYTIQIDDLSDMHNFHLSGPGVDKATDVPETGQVIWDVTLADGTYRYICDAHAATMRGTLTVGAVPTPVAPQKIGGSVGPGSKISFARTAKAGKTVLTIRDRSAKDNFHLIGPGVNKKTGVAATGTFTWTVTLRAGTYAFRSDAHARLKGTTKVS